MITSTDTDTMPSEAQEVINVLGSSGYSVQLLQTVTSLELYRTLQRGPYPLVWIASHSNSQGFSFGQTLITPEELGQFLEEARTRDVVLNSCYSMEHVITLQGICSANIVATINPAIDDRVAWSSALYLATSFTRTGTLRSAYQAVLSSGESPYRWFPALRARSKSVRDDDENDNIVRMEKTIERLTRIIQGDPYLQATGIINAVSALQQALKEHIVANDQWRNETEVRLRVLEANSLGNTLVLTKQTVRLLLSFFIVATILIIFLTWLLRG